MIIFCHNRAPDIIIVKILLVVVRFYLVRVQEIA